MIDLCQRVCGSSPPAIFKNNATPRLEDSCAPSAVAPPSCILRCSVVPQAVCGARPYTACLLHPVVRYLTHHPLLTSIDTALAVEADAASARARESARAQEDTPALPSADETEVALDAIQVCALDTAVVLITPESRWLSEYSVLDNLNRKPPDCKSRHRHSAPCLRLLGVPLGHGPPKEGSGKGAFPGIAHCTWK
jgi:hypothetical protein